MKANNFDDFHGYKVVPLKVSPEYSHHQLIYMKEHYIKVIDEEKPRGRTLFLLNVPPYINKDHLKCYFTKNVGEVVSVSFSEKPGKDEEGVSKFKEAEDIFSRKKTPFIFKYAYIVFRNTKSIQKALEISEICLYDDKQNYSFKSGMDKWKQEYLDNIIPEHELQIEIDTFMAAYDAKEAKTIQEEKEKEADNDGWVTVGKYGKKAGFEQTEALVNKVEDKKQKNKKERELQNFYTFQIREAKMQNIIKLRKRFEEDKQKIETLKKTRRFKPF